MVQEYLLGDNPFIGVSHLAQLKAREEQREASLERKVEVVKAAIEGGANGFTFSTHPSNLELLKYIKENHPSLIKKLKYHILVPYAASYVRRANLQGTAGLLKQTLKQLLRHYFLEILVSVTTLNYEKIISIFLLNEVRPYLEILPPENVESILLHEVLTEIIIAHRLDKLLATAKKYFEDKGYGFGVETRNMGHLKQFIEENNISLGYIMTPMNPIGYQMAPSKSVAEESIRRLGGETRIIVINILASGAVSLDDAINYLRGYSDVVYAVTSASTKPWRIRNNFIELRRGLSEK